MFQGFSKPLDIANKTSCTRVVTKAAIALPSISLVSIFPCSEICAIQQELAFQVDQKSLCLGVASQIVRVPSMFFPFYMGIRESQVLTDPQIEISCTPCSFAHGLHCHDRRLSSSVLRFAMRS